MQIHEYIKKCIANPVLKERHKIYLLALLANQIEAVCGENGVLLHHKDPELVACWAAWLPKKAKDTYIELVHIGILRTQPQQAMDFLDIQFLETLTNNHLQESCTDTIKERKTAIARLAWNSYAEAYQKRYQVAPLRNVKVNSLMGHLVDQVGKEIPDVLRFYVHMNDPYFENNAHNLNIASTSLQKIMVQFKKAKQRGHQEQEVNASIQNCDADIIPSVLDQFSELEISRLSRLTIR